MEKDTSSFVRLRISKLVMLTLAKRLMLAEVQFKELLARGRAESYEIAVAAQIFQ